MGLDSPASTTLLYVMPLDQDMAQGGMGNNSSTIALGYGDDPPPYAFH